MSQYRLYADGLVYHEDDFDDVDNCRPYYDDYQTIDIPDEVVDYIMDSV